MIAEGYSNRAIAERLGISENGVKGHVARLLAKFEVPRRAALVRAAQQAGVPGTTSSPAEMVALLSGSLQEVLGTTATSTLMRRASKRADIVGWDPLEPANGTSIETVRALVRALWPLLIEMTGSLLVSRLEARGFRATGELDPAEIVTWMK